MAAFLIMAIVSTQSLNFPFGELISNWLAVQAKAATQQAAETVKKINLVAILVEDSLLDNESDYAGLQEQEPDYLSADSIEERIVRYGRDVQKDMPYTKAVIIRVKAEEKPNVISATLERLYREGDGTKGEFNRLAGVVVIGRVALAVVNIKDHSFVSVWPYTDFDEKRFVYNDKARRFDINPNAKNFQQEVWHGLIRPPLSGEEGNKLLAVYLDKNHLFHEGVSDYAKFDRQIFYQDFLNEPNEISPELYRNYEVFLDHWEDIAYMRYDKELAQALYKLFNENLEQGDKKDNDSDGRIDEELGVDTDIDKDGLVGEDIGDVFAGRDNDGDGRIDEDGTDDNDNDGDKRSDEDGPGDMNGDGCAGECGVDEDNDAMDADKDGYADGQEKEAGTNPNDPDDKPGGGAAPFSNWIDEGGPNDDDEDGRVDEDSIEANDADFDGQIDEDPGAAATDEGEMFANLPDIQAENVITQYFQRYAKLFNKFLGETNDKVRGTGYFRDKYEVASGKLRSDIDSLPLLISQKDEYSLNYLKIVNDQYEAAIDSIADQIQQNIPLIAEMTVTGSSKINGKFYTFKKPYFINHSRFGDKYYILGRQFYVKGDDDYAQQISSPLQCTLYRGSSQKGEANAKAVYASRLRDYTTVGKPDDNKDYAGCYGNNSLNSKRCFSDAATDPVFDIKGAKRVPSGQDYEIDWRSCYDFKEKENFDRYVDEVRDYIDAIDDAESEEEKQQIDEDRYPRSSHLSLSKVYLVDQDGVKFTVAQAFEAVQISDFWKIVEDVISGNPLTFTASNVTLKDGTKVNSINLKIDPFVVGNIKSLFPHKEPTISTIRTQFQAGFSEDIPVDNPRYISFRDQNGAFREVIYPNVFDAKDLAGFQKMIEAKIAEMNEIPAASEYTEQLKSILTEKLDSAHVADALSWKEMDLNSKHLSVMRSFLNPSVAPYVSNAKPANGYEAAFIVADGDARELTFGINPAALANDQDIELNNPEDSARIEDGAAPEVEEEFKNEPDFPDEEEDQQNQENGDSEGESKKGFDAKDIITKWFPEINSWLNEVKSSMKISFQMACGSSEDMENFLKAVLRTSDKTAQAVSGLSKYDGTDSTAVLRTKDADYDGIPDDDDSEPEKSDSDEDGIPDGAETTSALNVSTDTVVYQANSKDGSYFLTIEARDSNGQKVVSDNFTKSYIFFLTPQEAAGDLRTVLEQKLAAEDFGAKLFNLGSNNPAQFSQGQTDVQIQPTDYEGELYAVAMTANDPNNAIISNTVKLKTTKESIKLYSYEKEKVTEKQVTGSEEIEEVKIRDDADALVGDVNQDTGKVVLKDENFELKAQSATKEFPTRFYVQKKGADSAEAVVFLKPDKKIVNIVSDKVTLDKEFQSFSGVNVQDSASDDATSLKYSETTYGNVDVIKGTEKIALIEPDGRIFLAQPDKYSLNIAESQDLDGPVIFELKETAKPETITKIYISTPPDIQILEPKDNFEKLLKNDTSSEIKTTPQDLSLFRMSGMQLETERLWKGKLRIIPTAEAAERNIADSDQDGLSDYQEFILNTIENNRDTDGDGFDDGQEIKGAYHPRLRFQKLFSDIDATDPAYKAISELYLRGVLSGFKDGSFRPERSITREEFMKLDLGAICISCAQLNAEKRAEVRANYQKNPFPDTAAINPELLMCAAEGKNRGIVSGYQGGSEKGYFRPQQQISRAEASKVLLETAGIPIKDQDPSKPWYFAYVLTAQRIGLFQSSDFPQVVTLDSVQFRAWLEQQIRNNGPFLGWLNSGVSRAEFALWVSTILKVKDCRSLDSDYDGLSDNEELYRTGTKIDDTDTDDDGVGDFEELLAGSNPARTEKQSVTSDQDFDGMPDAFEEKYEFNKTEKRDANEDADFDGLNNLKEFLLGTNPRKADSDGGSVNDFEEVKRFLTDPLNKDDDLRAEDFDNDGLKNDLEEKIGTSPYQADSDFGGEMDADEFYAGRNPLNKNDDSKDTDKDGLNDVEEQKLGTDAKRADTDGGGESDYSEVKRGANPLLAPDDKGDSDTDGLTDEMEALLGTNIRSRDTDNGGEFDGSEVKNGRNPLNKEDDNKDIDNDGLSNSDELLYRTNPEEADSDRGGELDGSEIRKGKKALDPSDDAIDSDNDGLSDLTERHRGTSLTRFDTDSDGMSDLSEIAFGTDPKDPKSFIYDPDRDSLSDKEERDYGTDPTKFDTDGGGQNDGSEIKAKKNPLDAADDDLDADGDGLTDNEEKNYGTNLNRRDSDLGGEHDLIEILTRSNPLDRSDDNWDEDQDGLSDNEEVSFGSDSLRFDTDMGSEHDGSERRRHSRPRDASDDQKIVKSDSGRADKDKDGLSDNDELRYGTNQLSADTDKGGECDLSEIFRKANPLKKEDDILGANVNDCDGDGLTNAQEEIYFTNKDKWDSDGGGQSDGAEIAEAKNPLNSGDDVLKAEFSDFDGDGLSNEEEFRRGLNLNRRDTDRGGETDESEVGSDSNPFDPDDDFRKRDSDSDGISDADEIGRYLTNPKEWDSDSGGESDGAEIARKSNPLERKDDYYLASSLDYDGDGINNSEENIYKTNPNRADSDSGGEFDGSEVKRGSNPLNRSDDQVQADLNDPDNDGLPNEQESIYGTDPFRADTDSGGIRDGDEVKNGTDPKVSDDDDPDNDGLNNGEERKYGSDRNRADSDGGGELDGKEISSGKNPLLAGDDDPDDDGLSNDDEKAAKTDPDNGDTDNGGELDGQELKRGANPLDGTDDGNFDSDNDGISDKEEAKLGTNPQEADSDIDGIGDGDELMRDTNPLEPSDGDIKGVEDELTPRIYIVGEKIETIYEQPFSTINKVVSSSIPADGESYLFLTAEIKNSDGSTKTDDNVSTVLFTVKEEGAQYGTINSQSVTVKNGVAETFIRSKTKSGLMSIEASLANNPDMPVSFYDVSMLPLEAANVEFETVSAVLVAGGYSESPLIVNLKDKNSNLASNGLATITVSSEGPVVPIINDEDQEVEGVQLRSLDGRFGFLVRSADDGTGIGTIIVKSGEIEKSFNFEVVDDVKLVITATPESEVADGEKEILVKATAVDSSGIVIPNLNVPVEFSLNDASFGEFQGSNKVDMTNSSAEIYLKVGTRAGTAKITAVAGGISAASGAFQLLPNRGQFIELNSDQSERVFTNSEFTVTALLYDQYLNVVTTDSSTPINLRATELSLPYVSISNPSLTAVNGKAKFTLKSSTNTGVINLVASSPKADSNPKIRSGTLKMTSVRKISSREVIDLNPSILYASVLGAEVGQFFEENYWGGWLLMSGKTEAVTTLLDTVKPKLEVATISIDGDLNIGDANSVGTRFVPSNQARVPSHLEIRQENEKLALGNLILVPANETLGIASQSDEIEELPYGLYLKLETEAAEYTVTALKNKGNGAIRALLVLEEGVEKVKIDGKFGIQIKDSAYSVATNLDANYPTVTIMNGAEIVASLHFWQDFSDGRGVTMIDSNVPEKDFASLAAGVYFQPLVEGGRFQIKSRFTGNSTNEPLGLAIIDSTQEMAADMRPGMSTVTLDNILENRSVGLDSDNKNMLFFSAGVNVGEANRSFASDIGIVLGDPTIRLKQRGEVSGTGFTKDIGRLMLNANELIKEVTIFDYNKDNSEDVLVSYDNGIIQLLENAKANPRLIDRGALLNISNGILAMDRGDLNKDGYDDLVIATRDSCLKGEICIYAYLNDKGSMTRRNLPLDIDYRVHDLAVGDLNKDGYDDIVTSDYSATIKAFYNVGGNINLKGEVIGNLGIRTDPNANLKSEVMLRYLGMTENNQKVPFDDIYFLDLPIPNEGGYEATLNAETYEHVNDVLTKLKDSGVEVNLAPADKKTAAPFVSMDYDKNFKNSTKVVADLNGGLVLQGDRLSYTITLKNSSEAGISNLILSDVIPSSTELDPNSVKCLECEADSQPTVIETGFGGRPTIFGAINIPAQGQRTIAYEVTVKSIPKVNISLGDNISEQYPEDNYLDVLAQIEGNDTGQSVYFYSSGSTEKSFTTTVEGALSGEEAGKNLNYNEIHYAKYITEPLTAEEIDEVKKTVAPEIIDPKKLEIPEDGGMPEILGELDNCRKEKDCDGDGVPDAFGGSLVKDKAGEQDNNNGGDSDLAKGIDYVDGQIDKAGEQMDAAAEQLENFIAKIKCAGGCLPLPINFAFFAPGPINLMGSPIGDDPGLPLFGFGVPGPFGIPLPCVGPICYASQIFRYYLVPTLTLRLANAICIGPYPGGFCLPFVIPQDGTDTECNRTKKGLCDKLNDFMTSKLQSVNTSISNFNKDIKKGVSAMNVMGGTAPKSDRKATGGMMSAGLGDYKVNALVSTNFSIPPFPILADWIKRQWEEINDKILTDPPDIYIVLPALKSFSGAVSSKMNIKDVGSVSDALAFLGTIPIVKIKVKEVFLAIPVITPDEIEQIKFDLEDFVEDAKKEYERVKKLWDKENADKAITEKILVDASALIATLEENIANINSWKKLPYQLTDLMNIQNFYLKQIACYLDAISEFVGGYLVRNIERAAVWVRAATDFYKALEDWKLIIKIAISYHASCDRCKTDRFSLLELVLKIFVALPKIPIIPFPKWPDLVIDLSNIQTGVEITWPEITFKPQPLIFPKLPRLRLPRIPSLSFKLPEIPVIPPAPDFSALLPKFPPLPLPKLPDIPPPPRLPMLPGTIKISLRILEKIMKILCLLKTGLIVVPEKFLKPEIEAMTQRPLEPLLPIDISIPILLPQIQYDFVRAIKISSSVNLAVSTGFIYDTFKDFADKWNQKVDEWVSKANRAMMEASRFVTENTIERLEDEMQEGMNKVNKEIEEGMDEVNETINPKYDNDDNQDPSMPQVETKDAEELSWLQHDNQFFPILRPYIQELRRSFAVMQEEAIAYQKEFDKAPAVHHLIATQEILEKNDPRLNRSIAELKARQNQFNFNKLPDNMRRIATFKDSLIAYIEDRNVLQQRLKDSGNIENSLRIIAQSAAKRPFSLASGNIDNQIIFDSSQTLSETGQTPKNSSFIAQLNKGAQSAGRFVQETIKDTVNNTSRYLAQTGDPQGNENSGSEFNLNLSGILIQNQTDGTLEKLIAYDGESNLANTLTFLDLEGDGDEDILYSYGKNLYFKENYQLTAETEIVTSSPKVLNLSELAPAASAVANIEVVGVNNGQVSINFTPNSGNEKSAAYELAYYREPNEFDLDGKVSESQSGKVMLLPAEAKVTTAENNSAAAVSYTTLKGEVTVSKKQNLDVDESVIYPGDRISTGADSEALLTFSEGSQLILKGDSTFLIPDLQSNEKITFENGEFTILKKSGENVLLDQGREIVAKEARLIEIQLHSEEIIELESGGSFSLEKIGKSEVYVSELDGSALLRGGLRQFVNEGDSVTISEPELIHPLEDSEIVITDSEEVPDKAILTLQLKKNHTFSWQQSGFLIVKEGAVEIIDANKVTSEQVVQEGMMLLENELLVTDEGSRAEIGYNFNSNLKTSIEKEEAFRYLQFNSDEKDDRIGFEFDLANGDYYARLYPITEDGRRGTGSSQILLSPQRCADKTPPVANSGSSNKEVAIFNTLKLDASSSFDDIKIVDYWWDLDTAIDSNEDGNSSNDRDYYSSFSNPSTSIGPFEDLNERHLKLTVGDDAGNLSTQEVTVKIYVPELKLNEAAAKTGIIEGALDPAIANMPITLLRKRGSGWEALKSPSSDANGNYLSNSEGKITVNDLKLAEGLEVKNSAGAVVATIDSETGQITVRDDRYHLEVQPTEPPLPTRVALIGPEGEIVSTFYVPDSNSDVTLDDGEIEYTAESVKNMSGVHVKDTNDQDDIHFQPIPADDPENPGGINMKKQSKVKRNSWLEYLIRSSFAQSEGEKLAEISANGAIYVSEGEVVELMLKESSNPEDPVVIEFYVEGEKVGEQFISVKKEKTQSVQVISAPASRTVADSDADGMPDSYELIYGFNSQDSSDSKKDRDSDGLSNFEEFLQGTNPTFSDSDSDTYSDKEELEKGYDPLTKIISPFEDIAVDYPKFKILMDLVNKNILHGYKIDGKYYFKPQQKINRAEFNKIILKTLCIVPRAASYREPAVFSDIPFVTKDLPWFFAETKESFLQKLITGYLGERDPETKRVPFKPANTITLAEAVKIMLEGLAHEDVIYIGKMALAEGEAWYAPYLRMAQDLGSYLRKGTPQGKVSYLVSKEEAKQANKQLSRIEFVEMAARVLSAYDCTKVDRDNDQIPDPFEIDRGLNPNNSGDSDDDPDGDGLTNAEEYVHGTDPKNPDTDAGGEDDGSEVERGSDPLNAADDRDRDPDRDDLSNAEETEYGTNPNNPDSDGGGIKDGAEVAQELDPLYQGDDDRDGDGLMNFEELTFGSDAKIFDTDGGGVDDGREANLGWNPKKRADDDSDFDGLSDDDEQNRYLTNRFKADTDDGGISDYLEVKNGTDPLKSEDDDSDGDGLSNLEESIYGTDPTKVDTDSGGEGDGREIKAGRDALKASDDQGDQAEANDSDGDGLTNRQERQIGSNINNKDSDGGGDDDFYEFYHNQNTINPSDDDPDRDGLSNAREKVAKTNPAKADSDDGGVDDGKELKKRTDPNNGLDDNLGKIRLISKGIAARDHDRDRLPDDYERKLGRNPYQSDREDLEGQLEGGDRDSDGDGLNDNDESEIYQTDPEKADTDGGFVNDGMEIRLAINPLDKVDDQDRDRDKLMNNEEEKYGTDPDDPDTDSGGVSDFDEVQAGSNPLDGTDDRNLDSDGDGLIDDFEVSIGTKSDDPDTDNGGISDGEEVRLKLNPLNFFDDRNLDGDGDGLLNDEEVNIYGTDPDDFDSDDGGIDDGTEVKLYSDALFAEDDQILDSDGDGLADKQEVEIYKTDPNKPDTDFGGVNDGDEVWQGNNPLNKNDDGNIDRDQDGLKNLDEVLIYGTDPDKYDTDGGAVGDGDEINSETNPKDKNDDKDLDRDQDGLINDEETGKYNTDPDDADSDDGGVKDGDEVQNGTDPNLKSDDLINDVTAGKEEGIYVLVSACNSCPCAGNVSNSAQVKEGDVVFGAIMNKAKTKVFTISNLVQFYSLEGAKNVPEKVSIF